MVQFQKYIAVALVNGGVDVQLVLVRLLRLLISNETSIKIKSLSESLLSSRLFIFMLGECPQGRSSIADSSLGGLLRTLHLYTNLC